MADATTGPGASRVAVRAGGAFDGQAMLPGGALVLCADGRISGVLPGGAPAPDGWPVADFSGATVLPGLIDSHVHLCGDAREGALDRPAAYSSGELDEVILAALRAQLAAGVTTVRDLGDHRYAVVGWRSRSAGLSVPHVVASGPPITSPGGHCWYMGGEAADVAALRAAVRDRAERGADVVKVMASGGVMTEGTDVLGCQFTLDQLRVVVDEAHARGLPVTAHAHGLPAVVQAVEAGVDGIEHCSCLTEHGTGAPAWLLSRLAARRVAVCPTLGRRQVDAPVSPRVAEVRRRTGVTWESRLALVDSMYAAGILIVSGVDAGISPAKPHGWLPHAVADLVTAGIPAAAALASATSVSAAACGVGDRAGRLRAGYDADLAVVGGDPVADIGALTDLRAVYLAGARVV